ncbi:hypothetical protein QUB33_22920 [Microcoleus sp. B3-A4]|uniref:hypothetical protein n=1 Tax=Microcoleus sp. B3-A4 TaxID=2818653 RepID=UPI002FD44671
MSLGLRSRVLLRVSVGGEARLDQRALDFRGDPTDESVCRSSDADLVNCDRPNFVGASFTNTNCLKPTIL